MKAVTRYAKSGNVHIAYQVFGEGPRDLLIIPGATSHIEVAWESPDYAHAMARLGGFARIITFDKRGQGLSDRGVPVPILEERADDVMAVMEAAGSSRVAIFAQSEGGLLAMLFAAAHPERTSALMLFGSFSHVPKTPEMDPAARALAARADNWDQGYPVALMAPSRVQDAAYCEWLGKTSRASVGVGDFLALLRMVMETDVTPVLPAISVPTLVLHRVEERMVPLELARDMAARIPRAKFVEMPGTDHMAWSQNVDELVDEIEDFLTGSHRRPEPDRILTTVMFMDIADSTGRAVQLGDANWRELLQRYYGVVERNLGNFRGRQVNKAGDGILASFDGPARAIKCSLAISQAVDPLGLSVRSGIHTGECEIIGDDLSGIAVHIGARVCSLAEPRETLISSTVKDLVAGSGLSFADRGMHPLKGVPGEWRLFAAS